MRQSEEDEVLPDHVSREMFEEIQRSALLFLALLGIWKLQSQREKETAEIREAYFSCSEARERSRYYASFHRHGSD